MRVMIVGATGGLGAAMARRFCTDGARVAVCGRDPARAEALVRELESSAPGKAFAVALDLSDQEKDVLALVAAGLNNQQIGTQLGVSAVRIKRYLAGISAVIGTDNRSHIVTIARRAGTIDAGPD